MSARRRVAFSVGVALLTSCALGGQALAAKPSAGVTVTNLGALVGDTFSRAYAINDQGEAVGVSMKDRNAGSPYRAVRWTRTGGAWKVSSLPTPSGANSAASDIDSFGNVSGDISGATGNHAAIWTSSSVVNLPSDPGCQSSAFGLNDRHEVVGNHCGAAVVWLENAGVWQRQALANAPGLTGISASDINESGQISGTATTSTGARHGVIWNRSGLGWEIVDLQFGSDWTFADDINDSAQVAGHYAEVCCSRAFIWTESTGGTTLASFGISSTATAINNYGQMVGYTSVPTGFHGFLWTAAGGTRDLTPSRDYTIATDINMVGQVVGQGVFGGRYLAALFTLPCAAWGTASCT